MRISRINPKGLNEAELTRLYTKPKVHTKLFGTIRLATEEEINSNPKHELNEKYANFIPIVWL